ncbi:MAG TPA: hypothetical protein VE057_29135 [Archangium sp.]|nr:hypothetical protein [Archangium sp.]
MKRAAESSVIIPADPPDEPTVLVRVTVDGYEKLDRTLNIVVMEWC